MSRHWVTFDFPNRIMYLKRTSTGPLVNKEMKKAAKEAGRLLDWLKRRGQLPGWSRKDEFAYKTEKIQMHYPYSASFDHVLKKGDPSVYHYELHQPDRNGPWKLRKAWRTDQDGNMIEEYLVP